MTMIPAGWLQFPRQIIMTNFSALGPDCNPRDLEFNRVVQPPALRTARTVHIRVVGINQAALLAAKNMVFAGRRPEPPAAHFRIYREPGKCRKQRNYISQDEVVRS